MIGMEVKNISEDSGQSIRFLLKFFLNDCEIANQKILTPIPKSVKRHLN